MIARAGKGVKGVKSTPQATVPELMFEKGELIPFVQRLLAHRLNTSVIHCPAVSDSHGPKERKWRVEATRQHAS